MQCQMEKGGIVKFVNEKFNVRSHCLRQHADIVTETREPIYIKRNAEQEPDLDRIHGGVETGDMEQNEQKRGRTGPDETGDTDDEFHEVDSNSEIIVSEQNSEYDDIDEIDKLVDFSANCSEEEGLDGDTHTSCR